MIWFSQYPRPPCPMIEEIDHPYNNEGGKTEAADFLSKSLRKAFETNGKRLGNTKARE